MQSPVAGLRPYPGAFPAEVFEAPVTRMVTGASFLAKPTSVSTVAPRRGHSSRGGSHPGSLLQDAETPVPEGIWTREPLTISAMCPQTWGFSSTLTTRRCRGLCRTRSRAPRGTTRMTRT